MKRIAVASSLFLISAALLPAACEMHMKGKKVYDSNRCKECHTIKGTGGSAGPNLTYVGRRRSREFILKQLKDPRKNNPNTNMPSFGNLAEEDINALIDYLASMK